MKKTILLLTLILSCCASTGTNSSTQSSPTVKSATKNLKVEQQSQQSSLRTRPIRRPVLKWVRTDNCCIEALAPKWAHSYSLGGTLNRVIYSDRKIKAGQSCVCGWGDDFVIVYGEDREETYVIPRIPCL